MNLKQKAVLDNAWKIIDDAAQSIESLENQEDFEPMNTIQAMDSLADIIDSLQNDLDYIAMEIETFRRKDSKMTAEEIINKSCDTIKEAKMMVECNRDLGDVHGSLVSLVDVMLRMIREAEDEMDRQKKPTEKELNQRASWYTGLSVYGQACANTSDVAKKVRRMN